MTLLSQPPVCCIAPPDLLRAVAEGGSPEEREIALATLATAETARAQRVSVTGALRQLSLTIADAAPAPGKVRSIYDVEHGGYYDLPGRKVRAEGDADTADAAVNEAYANSGVTYDFFREVFQRDGIDGRGMEMVSSVHYDIDYDNAAWTGLQMIYGDGSGTVFRKGSLTRALDVVGHELTHGITQYTAQLVYNRQSGALNESFSDVFGSLVKQYSLRQTADQADWLIGDGMLGSSLQGVALRSMKAPGTAWTVPGGGKDNQPGHMDDYADLPDHEDNGGVHINSGIPNHAFYLAATAMGGHAWERAGRIWYETLTRRLHARATFAEAAEATVAEAGRLFGADGEERKHVRAAWQQVGVI
ncbi:metalloprotease [Microtetraspora sp. NBRC 13810]|uniref:M4 family metallopeptidase n=1 Tax=Microtetraspora sp. NBRC 13810 TaxID=3030990 RepID=UPI0024A04B36|nr:M4 family metallopeptidase [Microtetraspora sp. NBRC 13810]GLW09523.1 metalloprotease [Microtetraspora sp. NBRC 13810]